MDPTKTLATDRDAHGMSEDDHLRYARMARRHNNVKGVMTDGDAERQGEWQVAERGDAGEVPASAQRKEQDREAVQEGEPMKKLWCALCQRETWHHNGNPAHCLTCGAWREN